MSKEDTEPMRWRWLDRLSLGAVAAAICVLLAPSLAAYLEKWASRYTDLPWWLPPLALLVVAAAALHPSCKGRWVACLGLKHFMNDPPPWVAVPVAMSLLAAIYRPDSLFSLPSLVISAEILIAAAAIIYIFSILPATRPATPTRATTSKHAPEGFDAIREWVKDDDPIETSADDRFDYDKIAERVARRLMAGQSVAVVGERGSGKSTLGKLVERHLDRSKHLFVQLSLWPYEASASAVTGILSALVEKVGEETDVTALHGIPASYLEATASAGGWYAALARLAGAQRSPESVVDELERLCARIGRHLVLWIDDAERFAGKRSLEGGAPPYPAERIEPIQSLLHLLDECKSITVVIADTGLENRIDPEKIARFVEPLPEIDHRTARRFIATVRERRGDWPRRVIAPVRSRSETNNDKRWQLEEYVARVVATPRALKQCLRLVIETWEAIPGEIDFDSMLAVTAVRVSHPDLFATLVRYAPLLRSKKKSKKHIAIVQRFGPQETEVDELEQSYDRNSGGTEFEELGGVLTRQLNKIQNPGVRDAYLGLLRYLIRTLIGEGSKPKANDEDAGRGGAPINVTVSEDSEGHWTPPVQHIFHPGEVDYFRRYQSQAAEGGESDQTILQAIEEWKRGSRDRLHDLLLDEGVAAHVGDFYPQLKTGKLEALLKSVAEAETAERSSGERVNGTCVAVEMLRMRVRDSGEPFSGRDGLFCEVLDRHLKGNPPAACRFVWQVWPPSQPKERLAGDKFVSYVGDRVNGIDEKNEANAEWVKRLREWLEKQRPQSPEPEGDDSPA